MEKEIKHKPKRTQFEVTYRPSFKALWNFWFKKKKLPLFRFELWTNGKEYKDGTDEIGINYDQQNKAKYFDVKILK